MGTSDQVLIAILAEVADSIGSQREQ